MKVSKFSLDYVAREEVKRPAGLGAGESALNEATILFSRPILHALEAAPEQRMRLHDLVDTVHRTSPVSSFEEFQGVIGQLESLGLIEIVEKDLRGNHLLHLVKSV